MSIRIGTRSSKLALWQAEAVQQKLTDFGWKSELVPLESKGDLDLQTPLHLMGGTGLFTKVLDDALLREEIDIAVHSLKDYPTLAPDGIQMAAVLARENPFDLFVYKGDLSILEKNKSVIATGSIRRKAQWLHRFPQHEVVNLRGNVQTRLQKVQDNDWSGGIFAHAGLLRLGINPSQSTLLDWMIPAPAQGVVGICCRTEDRALQQKLQKLSDPKAWTSSQAERAVLRTLEGGCSAPIGALAILEDKEIHLKACLSSVDGTEEIRKELRLSATDAIGVGERLAEKILANGGESLMKKIREQL